MSILVTYKGMLREEGLTGPGQGKTGDPIDRLALEHVHDVPIGLPLYK